MRRGEYLLQRRYALDKLGSPLSFSKSCTSHMYVSGVSLFRESPIVFEVKPSNPCLNVTSNRETIRDNLQHDSYTYLYVHLPLHNWAFLLWGWNSD